MGWLWVAGLLALTSGWTAAAGADSGVGTDSGAAPPDSAVGQATLRVQSLPTGLQVLVDSVLVGRTPIDSLSLPPGTVRIRVLAADPRRFNPAPDAAVVTLRRGATVSITFDLRPSIVVRTDPEPASILLVGRPASAADSLLGETPLSIRPSVLEAGRLRLTRASFADTTLPSTSFLGDSTLVLRVRLRPVPTLAAPPPALTSGAPIYRKAWFQWTLIGIGTALSGAAVYFHHEGDDRYDQYLQSSDVSEIEDLYDQTIRYDRWAAGSLIVGQICLIGGVMLLVTGQR